MDHEGNVEGAWNANASDLRKLVRTLKDAGVEDAFLEKSLMNVTVKVPTDHTARVESIALRFAQGRDVRSFEDVLSGRRLVSFNVACEQLIELRDLLVNSGVADVTAVKAFSPVPDEA